MTNKPKDYESTVMRMAGNIAAGMVSSPHLLEGKVSFELVAADAVKMARAIIIEVQRTASKAESK